MQCPIDSTTLLISSRNNIEIDYCPQCRGVWLDRGELDKLIVHNGQQQTVGYSSDKDEYRHENHYDQTQRKPRKKENFLSELFDF